MMHAENGMAIDVVAEQTVAAGTTDPIGHGLARKAVFEGEATNRVIRLAEAAGVPVYIVHLSAREALAEVRAARDRGHGRLRRDLPAVPVPVARRPGQRLRGRQVRVLAAAPPQGPLGRPVDRAASRTTCRSSSTDHCPFDFEGQKELGRGDFRKVPNGLPGRRGPGRPDARRRRRRRPHQPRALGRDHLDRAGQAVRDVPAQGLDQRRRGRRPRRLRPEPHGARSRPRPTTWTSTTRATRAARSRAPATSSCRAASVIVRNGEFTGRKGHGRFVKRAHGRPRPAELTRGARDAPASGARFGHVNVTATDWRRLAAFYTDVFGCELVPAGARHPRPRPGRRRPG